MSHILRRIIDAQTSNDNPFFKDAEGRIIELTAHQGEVFTGYYQADSDIYYTERDWLEYQRQLELDRITEEEYQAEQKRLAAQRAERERKRKELEAKQKEEEDKAKNKQSLPGKTLLFGIVVVAAIIALSIVFWPAETTISETSEPDVVVTDTIQEKAPTLLFGNAIITGKDVRMRAEPNLKAKIITFFPKEGERVLVLQAVSDTLRWARIQRENGTEGWVFGEYVKKVEVGL
ncbi:SH3 domain-containing protein [Rasiella sp. SM2506]|uniref:SH3 domain-containing protein n=1 Tax=Rasiella sp. SM2506 TaxID=3423914 RepID=UPI003D7994FD